MNVRNQDSAVAVPTKRFFVSTLTRDICIADAIIALMDNYQDGAMRLAYDNDLDYTKYFVKIEIAADHFYIANNCKGNLRDLAKKIAFKMGREPDDDGDSDAEALGMYGVGVKRAIYNMGRNVIVHTCYVIDMFEMPISSHWLDAKNWYPLPINETIQVSERLDQSGRRFTIGICTKVFLDISQMEPSITKSHGDREALHDVHPIGSESSGSTTRNPRPSPLRSNISHAPSKPFRSAAFSGPPKTQIPVRSAIPQRFFLRFIFGHGGSNHPRNISVRYSQLTCPPMT